MSRKLLDLVFDVHSVFMLAVSVALAVSLLVYAWRDDMPRATYFGVLMILAKLYSRRRS